MKKRAFTLLEVMIVILIIGLLLAIAIPQMMTSRERSQLKTCQSNMRVFDLAKAMWAMEESVPQNSPATLADIAPYLKSIPTCPAGGTYDLGTIGTRTQCSIPDHPPGH